MINEQDKRIIRVICDTHPREHWVYHFLLALKHRVNPEHYIYAGEYTQEKRTEKAANFNLVFHLN